MIRLEAFNVPEAQLRSFFSRFTSEVPQLPDYGKALCEQQFFPMVSFELNVGTEDSGCPRLKAPTESPKKR
jgi:hypothetical protein